jgi:hypothetical protein
MTSKAKTLRPAKLNQILCLKCPEKWYIFSAPTISTGLLKYVQHLLPHEYKKILRIWNIPLINNQLGAQFLLYIFISILYMFRATLCSSSGESIVSIQHLVYVILCRWPSGMQVGSDLHTGRSPTQSALYQMLYWYNWLSWWWAQGCSKHVENRNKYI